MMAPTHSVLEPPAPTAARQVQSLTQARKVLEDCRARWPDHAGLLHYITHASDFPNPDEAAQVCVCLTKAKVVCWPGAGCYGDWTPSFLMKHACTTHTALLTHTLALSCPSQSQGLSAGLRLADVATASCHALHMKSHLFLQMGNWAEVVDSNTRAVAASDAFCGR